MDDFKKLTEVLDRLSDLERRLEGIEEFYYELEDRINLIDDELSGLREDFN